MLGSFLSTFMLNLAEFLSLKAEASCKCDKAETVKLHEAALSCWPDVKVPLALQYSGATSASRDLASRRLRGLLTASRH